MGWDMDFKKSSPKEESTAPDPVSKIMTKRVVTIGSDENAIEALQIMANKGIGSVIVTENGRPVGIVTERDIIRRLARDRKVLDKKVISVMSKSLISVSPETPIFQAIQIMRKNNIRRLPVISGSRLKGIVTIHKDLLYWALLQARSSLKRGH